MLNTDKYRTYSCPFCHRSFEHKGLDEELYFPCPFCQCEIDIGNLTPLENQVQQPSHPKKITDETKRTDSYCKTISYGTTIKQPQPTSEKNANYVIWGLILLVLWPVLAVIIGMNNLTAGYCIIWIPLAVFVFIAFLGMLSQSKGSFTGPVKFLRAFVLTLGWILIFFCTFTKTKK